MIGLKKIRFSAPNKVIFICKTLFLIKSKTFYNFSINVFLIFLTIFEIWNTNSAVCCLGFWIVSHNVEVIHSITSKHSVHGCIPKYPIYIVFHWYKNKITKMESHFKNSTMHHQISSYFKIYTLCILLQIHIHKNSYK